MKKMQVCTSIQIKQAIHVLMAAKRALDQAWNTLAEVKVLVSQYVLGDFLNMLCYPFKPSIKQFVN